MQPKLLRQLNLTLSAPEAKSLAKLSDAAPGLSGHTLGRVALQVGFRVCLARPAVIQAQLRSWQQQEPSTTKGASLPEPPDSERSPEESPPLDDPSLVTVVEDAESTSKVTS